MDENLIQEAEMEILPKSIRLALADSLSFAQRTVKTNDTKLAVVQALLLNDNLWNRRARLEDPPEEERERSRALLRLRLHESGVPITEVARRARLSPGVLHQTLNRGGSRLTLERTLAILEAIDVPPEEFYSDLFEYSY